MRDIVIALDSDEQRSRQQAQTVINLFAPLDESASEPVSGTDSGTADEAVHVHLLHVFTDNPEGASVTNVGAVIHARNAIEAAGFAVTLHERSGDPGEEIVDFAEEYDADLLCVAGRKRSPAGKLLFGSVTQTVLLQTDRPILLAGSQP